MSIRILLADNQILVREGIKKIFERDDKLEVICEVYNGEDCLEKIKIENPDVIIIGITIPKKNGIEVLKELRKRKSDVKVIFLTNHDEIEYINYIMENGANGYLIKDVDSSELLDAVYSVVRGERYIQKNIESKFNSYKELLNSDRNKIVQLTTRELEVLKKLTVGMLNKEIATNLNISERTVKNHIFSIFKKIEVTDRTQAAIFSIRNKLVDV